MPAPRQNPGKRRPIVADSLPCRARVFLPHMTQKIPRPLARRRLQGAFGNMRLAN